MIAAIHQPYLFPNLGYYRLVNLSDIFIFLDDVNFIKRGYSNRNTILLSNNAFRFTLPVIHASQNKLFCQHFYVDDATDFLNLLNRAYNEAPFFDAVIPVIECVLSDLSINLAQVNAKSVDQVFRYLGISKKLVFSSSFPKSGQQTGMDRLIELLRCLGIRDYVNASSGKSLYSKADFSERGVQLRFINGGLCTYRQINEKFTPNLSIIDIMMWCEKSFIIESLMDFELE